MRESGEDGEVACGMIIPRERSSLLREPHPVRLCPIVSIREVESRGVTHDDPVEGVFFDALVC